MFSLAIILKRGACPAFILALAVFSCTSYAADYAADSDISHQRQLELVKMVRNDCGSCHGLTLKGGLGSPLLPESLRDKSVIGLREVILRGRTGTAMPPWSPFISEKEAEWIVDQLMKGFPDAH